jgi:glycosyltransferase involved in cell wall biosynthesis
MNSVDPKVLPAGGARRDRAFTVAYHGTLTRWYGIDLLIDAFAQLRDGVPGARLMILGEGDALAGLRRRADARHVADAVEFSGRYLPIEETLARVAAADCGVIPNLPSRLNRFALSSKLFEYVALGVPAAVARLETLAAHFSDQEVTFFTPGDAASLASSLRVIADDPVGAAQRAERARAVAQRYSWDSQRAGYLDLLARLSNSGNSSA